MGDRKPWYDVVLVQPGITWVYDSFEHLGLAYLAAALRRDGFTVRIVDAVLLRLKMSDLYRELDSFDIGVLGVTLVSHGYTVTVRFLEHFRQNHPDTKIVAGGHFATFAASKIAAHTNVFDAIVLGEGEYTFADYCRSVLRGDTVVLRDVVLPGRNTERSHDRIVDMDQLEFPARDCLELALSRGSTAAITSSRGCYARCTFCTVHNFYTAKNGPRWVARSIENIIEELRYLHREFEIRQFAFIDDNFMGPGKNGQLRALEFAEAYARSGLPMTFHIDCRAVDLYEDVIAALTKCGLRSVFVGVESVSPSDLVVFRKDLRAEANWKAVEILKKYDQEYTLSMIMFNPDTTERAILDNCRFLREADYYPRNPLAILNIYEGTDLAKVFEKQISGPFWDYRFDFCRESIREIHDECMRFCKDTLPFERELSWRPGSELKGRRELHRLRLLYLEDVTRTWNKEPLESVRRRWSLKLAELRTEMQATSETRVDSHFVIERLYLTGSPMDADPSNNLVESPNMNVAAAVIKPHC